MARIPTLALLLALAIPGTARAELKVGEEWLSLTASPPTLLNRLDARAEWLPFQHHSAVAILGLPSLDGDRMVGMQYRYYPARSPSIALQVAVELRHERSVYEGNTDKGTQLAPLIGWKWLLPRGFTVDFQFGHIMLTNDADKAGHNVINVCLGYSLRRKSVEEPQDPS